eukprot:6190002-Pleurochrysis_carterae.AAC.1
MPAARLASSNPGEGSSVRMICAGAKACARQQALEHARGFITTHDRSHTHARAHTRFASHATSHAHARTHTRAHSPFRLRPHPCGA